MQQYFSNIAIIKMEYIHYPFFFIIKDWYNKELPLSNIINVSLKSLNMQTFFHGIVYQIFMLCMFSLNTVNSLSDSNNIYFLIVLLVVIHMFFFRKNIFLNRYTGHNQCDMCKTNLKTLTQHICRYLYNI